MQQHPEAVTARIAKVIMVKILFIPDPFK